MTDDGDIAPSREFPDDTAPSTDPLGGLAEIDWRKPNIARMYDYLLGGVANFAVDREMADEGLRLVPTEQDYCRHNRAFLGRAVRHLVTEFGIDQFLDLGSGVPTVGNVHDIAQHHDPASRVAYVDWELVACHHARQLTADNPRVTVTEADVSEPDKVLAAPGVADLFDFTRPIAILAFGVFDLVERAEALSARYRDACAPGSALAVSNNAQLTRTDAEIANMHQLLAGTTTPRIHIRDREQVAGLLPGYRLLDPGVVPAALWRPDEPVTWEEARRGNVYGAVGVLE